MSINRAKLLEMLCGVSAKWLENTAELSDIDSRFGDGDHGVTIEKIAKLIQKEAGEAGERSMAELLDDLGSGIMAIGGGSAGPLYGTMVEGLGLALGEEAEIDGPLLKRMLQSSLEAMEEITKAKVGDKTMMDALIPAVKAAWEAADDETEVLQAAAEAARQGAEASREFASKFGRARSYGEQTIGTPDAGALSTALFFEGLAGK